MTTKRRVFLDGNGSSQINVEGLGAYVPATDLLDVKQKLGTEIQQLKDQLNAMQLERSTHIDDIGIDRFTNAMRLKMAYARSKGRSGWNDQALCSGEQLAAALVEHLSKGNDGTFEDVANFAMMLHQRKEDPKLLFVALANHVATMYVHTSHRKTVNGFMNDGEHLAEKPIAKCSLPKFIEYLDSSKHPELISGQKYCVKTADDSECYAKYVVYDGGHECNFIELNTMNPISIIAFRFLDKELDMHAHQVINIDKAGAA